MSLSPVSANFDPAAAAAVLIASRTGTAPAPAELPAALQIPTLAAAYAVQDAVVRARGAIAGWKVGAPAPDGPPMRAALTADSVFVAEAGECVLPAAAYRVRGVEAELAYQVVADLPPRAQPYGTDEVLAALGRVHAAIEVCDTRYSVWGGQADWHRLADQACHGALVVGSGHAAVASVDALRQPVALRVSGTVAVAHEAGGNPAGDLLRLVVWLANAGAHSLGGLRAGQWITTGSFTGTRLVEAGDTVSADFPGVGQAALRFA